MSPEHNDTPTSFYNHLLELRTRLLRVIAAVITIFIALFYFSNDIYLWLATPLLANLPVGTSMIATSITSSFLTPMKLSFILSIFITIPFIFFEVWGFVAPGLYAHEKKWILPLVMSSSLLFLCGMAFAYFVIFPLMFKFFIATAPLGIKIMPDIHDYLSFTLKLLFAFGLAFQVPIATITLLWCNIVSRKKLSEARPYVIVMAFIVGMLLTPPDVLSQVLLAIPIWLLYELGLLIARFIVPAKLNETRAC